MSLLLCYTVLDRTSLELLVDYFRARKLLRRVDHAKGLVKQGFAPNAEYHLFLKDGTQVALKKIPGGLALKSKPAGGVWPEFDTEFVPNGSCGAILVRHLVSESSNTWSQWEKIRIK